MEEKARRRKRQLAEFAAVAAFFVVLWNADWLVQAASLVIFRLDPGAVPESFVVVYRTASQRYAVTGWRGYAKQGAEKADAGFRLPDPAGRINGKTTFSFAVLEDDGVRQVIEVRTDGMIRAVSRYAAYANRVEPISYRSMNWGYGQSAAYPAGLIALALGMLAAWGTLAGASRITRLQQT